MAWWRSIGDQHAIAVGEKAVAFANGFGIGSADEFSTGESTDKHEEGRFRQVEIREQGAGVLEFIWWANENPRAA